jgi:hypothetical protein
MLYVRGQTGTALVRIARNKATGGLACTFLNDGSIVQIDKTTDATFLAGTKALEAKIAQLCGPPTIVADISELA